MSNAMGNETDRFADEWALAKLPHVYARALDRRDKEALAELFTGDATFERWPRPTRDFAGIVAIPDELSTKYRSTFHAVFNQTVELDADDPDRATGEVYCLAHHMYDGPDGQGLSNDVRIRYQDRYRRGADGHWRFSFRRVVVDGRTIGPVTIVPPGPDDA
jgi:ketosteroid isomerase-like protein